MSLVRAIESSNVIEWVNDSRIKYTLEEIYKKFDIKIENSPLQSIWFDTNLTARVLVDEHMLDYIGYDGAFNYKDDSFRKLLKENNSIAFEEVFDENDPARRYITMSSTDFALILSHVHTDKARELQTLLHLRQTILCKYWEYETRYAICLAELREREINFVMHKFEELKAKFISETQKAIEDRNMLTEHIRQIEQRSASERKLIEEQATGEKTFLINLAKEIEQLAAEERTALINQVKEIERCAAIERQQIAQRAAIERLQISQLLEDSIRVSEKRIVSSPVQECVESDKMYILSLYRMKDTDGGDNEWYIMHPYRENWERANRKLIMRGMMLLNCWENIPRTINIGKTIRRHFRHHLSWDGRSNKIKANKNGGINVTDRYIRNIIESIITNANYSYKLTL